MKRALPTLLALAACGGGRSAPAPVTTVLPGAPLDDGGGLVRKWEWEPAAEAGARREAARTRRAARERRAEQLRFHASMTNGAWHFEQSASYFLVSSIDDGDLRRRALAEAEALRAIYARDLGPATGTRAPVVVRVCRSRAEYFEYGGAGGSGGYFSAIDEEVVIHADRSMVDGDDPFRVLRATLLFAYLHMDLGVGDLPSWFGHGLAAYYGGYQRAGDDFEVAPDEHHRRIAESLARTERTPTIGELLDLSQRQYYGSNDLDLRGGEVNSLGWSFVWLLREGAGSDGWDPAWDGLLDRYLAAFVETHDDAAARAASFERVDMRALEAVWLRSMLLGVP